ncbi:serine/threonine protein kinase, partial [Prochlorothrix hollandica]|uniref:serine/threonine protein kinase n=1 Tax=Prochlorothrix hollandica TaxID=1223 RepID=UPI00333F4C14
PYIVQCLGADEIPVNSSQASIPYIIFEYVAGESIDRWLDKADLSLEQILSLGRQVAEGLAHLHRHGVYHQDIKPNNLFWTETGVKIIDFNIAAFEDENTPPSAGTRRSTPPDRSRTTALNNSDRVHRDLYALGITLYECLTQGCYPFESNAPPRGVQPQDPRSHSSPNPDLTDALVNWLCRVLAPYQADRFPDAATVLTELDRACQPEPAPLPAPEPTVPETSEPRLDPAAMPPPVIAAVSPPARKTPEPAVTVLPPPSIPVLTYDFTPPQCIVLDPTTSYPRPENCQPIASEVDWLQHHPDPHSTPSTLFWIQGVALCEWVRVWLQVWHHNDWIAETKAHPGEILKTYLGDTSPDPTWTIAQQSDLATRLQRYPVPQALSQVLADLSQSPPHLWLDPTNRENLAQWLSLTVPAPWQPLEQAWLAQLPPSPFQPYYATANKQQLLRCWLGLDPDQPVPTDLGIFPGTVPDLLQAEFDQHWYQSINQSLNQPLNQPTPVSTQLSLNLALENLPDRPRIATQAYTVLCHNPQLISRDRIHSLQPYLTPEQATELQDHLAPPCPDPLPPAASTAQALTWATQQYLPFRCWEVNHGIDRVDRRSTRLADGFIDWIVGTYPDLKEIRTADSPLNYKVAAMVDELSQTAAVLWVVIDGLSWLDHQQILEYLTQSRKLQLQEPLTPCFSILPTVTGYAKWSLYSQKLPGGCPLAGRRGARISRQERL